MGIVSMWLHVDRPALEACLARPDWTPAALESALRARGVADDEVNDLVYYGYEEPDPQWNESLARLVTVKAFDVDKAFAGTDLNLTTVAASLPGLEPIARWHAAKSPVVKLPAPWASTDIVGFEVVATADQVRALLPALAPFRDRAACSVHAKANSGGLLAGLSHRKRSLRAWVENDSLWNAWKQLTDALDAVASSRDDALGVSTG